MRRTGKGEAVRTCLGCRARRLQKEMIRIVRDPDGAAVFDLSGKLPGRGAYVCPTRSCVTGLSSASLSRVLRQDVALPSAEKILSGLDEAVIRRMLDLLSMARKAGMAVCGADAVTEALGAGRGSLAVAATDIAGRTLRGLEKARRQVPLCTFTDRGTLGAVFGRESVSVALITSAGMARRLLFLEGHLTALKSGSYHDLN